VSVPRHRSWYVGLPTLRPLVAHRCRARTPALAASWHALPAPVPKKALNKRRLSGALVSNKLMGIRNEASLIAVFFLLARSMLLACLLRLAIYTTGLLPNQPASQPASQLVRFGSRPSPS
jgi:hypothetical protein